MIASQFQWTFRSVRLLLVAVALVLLLPSIARGQIGNDNPTGTSGVFNGNVNTGCSYDPYTGNATRSVTDIAVAGAAGAYPLAFTRTMNTRYTPGAGTLEFGQAGTWRHNYQWSIDSISHTGWGAWGWMPPSYWVNYPDGRRVLFADGYRGSDPNYRGAPGISDRFQQLTNPNGGEVYLLLPDGGKIWFHASVTREAASDGGSVISTFDFTLMGIIDPHLQVTAVSYPADGSMTITEPIGRWLKLFYITTPWGGDSVLDRVVASDGRSVKYNYGPYTTPNGTAYSSLGNVVYFGDSTIIAIYGYQNSNVDPDGRPIIQWAIDPMYSGPMWAIGYTFVPDAAGGVYGQLQSENYLDPRNGTVGAAVSTLSASGNSRSETRGDGPGRTFNYSAGRLMDYTDFKGAPSSIGYDGNGYTGSLTDARVKTTYATREPRIGALSLLTHPGDNSTVRYGYTDANNPYYLSYRTDERDKTTSFTRNANHQVERVDYPNSAYETFSYNGWGQVTSHRMTNGGTETFYYDPRGLIYGSINPDGTTYYYYDGNDRLENVMDPRGNRTWFQYNARGQVTRVTYMDGNYVSIGYDNHGDRISVEDERRKATNYVYDDYKRVVSVTNPMTQTTQISYALDPGWAYPYLHTTNSLKYVVSPLNKNVVFDYDENFRKIDQIAAYTTADEARTFFHYDAVGNLTSVQDPRLNVTSFGYDDRNRRTSATNPAPFNNEVTRWEYDYAGNLTKETRPDLLFRRMEYDSMNRVIDTYGFATEHTHYDRDPAGNVWQMIDPKNAIYGFGYDLLGRKTSAAYPTDATNGNRTESWSYTTGGILDYHINPGGQVNRFHFDLRNRLDHSWWDNAVGPDITTGYDAASRLTSIVTNSGVTTVAFGYDDANRQVWEDQTLSGYPTRRVNTPRDADGNRTSLGVANFYYITYGYTQRNQLDSVDGFAHFQYDKSGNMLTRQGTWIYANETNFAYDQLNRVSQAEQGKASGYIYARSHYRYDNLSREMATWRDEQGNKGERFGYDAMGQLNSADYNADDVSNGNAFNPTRTVSYSVDALNRQSVNENGAVTGYSPNGMNQYTSVGGAALTYDGNFNQTGYGTQSTTFNAANQLTSVVNPGNGASAQFTYDGLGRCVRRIVNGTTRLFTYDGWKPMLEWDGAGNWVAWNIYGAGPDEILARYDSSGQVSIYKQDQHSNVVAVLDQFGNVTEKYTYDAFGQPKIFDSYGNERTGGSAIGNRFMFTGREYIKELGIYDYRNRFYHPALGRFLQGDPTGFAAGDANLFRYCGGDPVNKIDPNGLTDSKTTYQNEDKNPGSSSLGSWNFGLGSSNSVIATGQGISTQGWWTTSSGLPTGLGGDPRLSGSGGGGGGPDSTKQGGGGGRSGGGSAPSGTNPGSGGYASYPGADRWWVVGWNGSPPESFPGGSIGFLGGVTVTFERPVDPLYRFFATPATAEQAAWTDKGRVPTLVAAGVIFAPLAVPEAAAPVLVNAAYSTANAVLANPYYIASVGLATQQFFSPSGPGGNWWEIGAAAVHYYFFPDLGP